VRRVDGWTFITKRLVPSELGFWLRLRAHSCAHALFLSWCTVCRVASITYFITYFAKNSR